MNKGQAVFRTYTTLGRCLSALPSRWPWAWPTWSGDVLFKVRDDHRRMVVGQPAAGARCRCRRPDDAVLLDRWARRSFRAYARYWVEGARLRSHVAG